MYHYFALIDGKNIIKITNDLVNYKKISVFDKLYFNLFIKKIDEKILSITFHFLM